MGMRIATNIQSLTAQRNLGQVRSTQETAMSRLSSGSRINKAGDDAAGLAISEKLKANIRGTRQAERNAGDGVSLIQTAEGGLNEVSSILIRLRELSVQSASDTVGESERGFADLEFQQLTQEVQRIATSTKYNGKSLLDSEEQVFDFQIGIHNNAAQDRLQYNSSVTDSTVGKLGIAGLGVGTKENAQNNLEVLDTAINNVNGSRANLGAMQNRLMSTINNLQVKAENLSAANSRIRDTDVALESAELAKSNILSQAGLTVLAQANQSGAAAMRLLG